MINKFQYRIKQSKKILHKIGKHWAVISTAMLGLLTGGTMITSNHVNADVNTNHNTIPTQKINNQSETSSNVNQSQDTNSLASNSNLGSQLRAGRLNVTTSIPQTISRNNKVTIGNTQQKYLNNNEAHDNKSFTTINGFLTANSWYQPKMIHQNGQNWVPSKPNDLRPILMDWWPDKTTQVNYLNYMSKHGLLSGQYNQANSLNDLFHGADVVQDNLEKNIYTNKNYINNTMKPLFVNFVSSQPQWNEISEDPQNDGLQGGFFKFENSPLTPNTNSPYRELGRAGNIQDRTHNNTNDMEFLLGNDIDNSNPTVQAEDLNNMYYINNIGSILKDNPSENFDGFREDATGSMDYDVTDILGQYLTDKYDMKNNDNNADKHLNILEDDEEFTPDIKNNDALTQDENQLFELRACLLYPTDYPTGKIYTGNRLSLSNLADYYGFINRADDYTENQATPNYSRVNLHDNDSFIVPITKMYKQLLKQNPKMSPYDAVEQAAKTYDDDAKNTIKHYGQYYNIPSAYAYLLSNKDTVPEVYYGDLYVGYKPYMSTKTIYYNAINALLQARKKYVAGGQQMRTHGDNNNILSSVRFGKGILKPTDSAVGNARTEGEAVITGVDPKYNSNNSIKVYMGKAHANEAYQPVLYTTSKGIDVNNKSTNLIRHTDANGYLTLNPQDLKGVANPQVIGNISVWVPVGAPTSQNAQTLHVNNTPQDGNVYHSNAALDSHVLYESFSPFTPIVNNNNQRLDNVISQPNNVNQLKDWGITDFRFPPHYDPLKHNNSFIDTIDQNGYAFQDRYDLNHTKYGSVNDMLNANAKLHQGGIHTLADLVLNQIYDLPGQQVVPVERINAFSEPVDSQGHPFNINNQLYVDNSVSNKDELQDKFGGAFLNQLKDNPKYKNLFTTKQVSTNQPIDARTPLKQWSAKYMNGSNIQGHGLGYVLKDNNTGKYYNDKKVPSTFVNGQYINGNTPMEPKNPKIVPLPKSSGSSTSTPSGASITPSGYPESSENSTPSGENITPSGYPASSASSTPSGEPVTPSGYPNSNASSSASSSSTNSSTSKSSSASRSANSSSSTANSSSSSNTSSSTSGKSKASSKASTSNKPSSSTSSSAKSSASQSTSGSKSSKKASSSASSASSRTTSGSASKASNNSNSSAKSSSTSNSATNSSSTSTSVNSQMSSNASNSMSNPSSSAIISNSTNSYEPSYAPSWSSNTTSLASMQSSNSNEINSVSQSSSNTNDVVHFATEPLQIVPTNDNTTTHMVNTTDPNDLQINQQMRIGDIVITRKPVHYNWFNISTTCLAHNHIQSVGKVKDYGLTIYPGELIQIQKMFTVNHHGRTYRRYEIVYNGHNYFVTGNKNFMYEAYYQPTTIKHHHRYGVRGHYYYKAFISSPCLIHSKIRYTSKNSVTRVRRGQFVKIRRIVPIGSKYQRMTRFELTNGMFITSNHNFVKLM